MLKVERGAELLGCKWSVGNAMLLWFDSKHSRLQGTGAVWESCGRAAKVSQDNKSAVAKVCLSQLRLLQDAGREVEEVSRKNREVTKMASDLIPYCTLVSLAIKGELADFFFCCTIPSCSQGEEKLTTACLKEVAMKMLKSSATG